VRQEKSVLSISVTVRVMACLKTRPVSNSSKYNPAITVSVAIESILLYRPPGLNCAREPALQAAGICS
jgi:hypothetical protein